MTDEERQNGKFESQLRNVVVLLFGLEILSVVILRRLTATDIGVLVSIFSLWGIFEWIIRLNRVLHRIEDAATLKEALIGLLSLFRILLEQEIANRVKQLLSRIWNRAK